jgi:hypothetical protein
VAAKKSSPPFDFIVEHLKKTPTAPYAEIAAAAQKKGLKIFPIMYGRAKAMLGLVDSAPRGTGKAAKEKKAAARRATAARGGAAAAERRAAPARAARAAKAAPASDGGIESVIAQVKASAAERESYRAALQKIREILDGVI